MTCPRCHTTMTNTCGGNYTCPKCALAVNDLVYRGGLSTTDYAMEQLKSIPQNNNKLTGWICPICNRGVSPYINICPCTETKSSTIQPTTINSSSISASPIPLDVTSTTAVLDTTVDCEDQPKEYKCSSPLDDNI